MIAQKKTKKLTLISVFFTFFVDNLCWAIVFPIFAPYFLNPQTHLFPPGTDAGTRSMVLGFFLMAFSFGQFIGCPLIGEYADKHGRKKALAVSVFFTLIGVFLSALSIQINSLYGLFASRLITGIFASSTTVCLSCISDLVGSEKAKVKNFGVLSMLAGLSFVIGAFFGGKLSDPTLNPHFTTDFPLWFAAFLTLVNFFFILFGFTETSQINPAVKFHFFEAFRHLKLVLRTERIKRIYTVYFFFIFSWTILFQFIPILTVNKFNYTNSDIGDLALFMGVCWAVGSGYLNHFFIKHFDSMLILEFCLIGFTILCGLVIFPTRHVYGLLIIVGLCVILGGIAWPICIGLISSMAPGRIQGKIMGLSQSVQSFAMTLGPALGGLAFHVSLNFPFLVAAIVSLFAVIIYYFILKDR